MDDFEQLSDEECLKLIEDDAVRRMIDMELASIGDDGTVDFAFGSVNVYWKIQKELMAERFGRTWQSPQDRFPDVLFD